MLAVDRQDPYLRTHPITRERVDFVRNFLTKSKFTDAPTKPEFVTMHKRMRAKLLGYLDPGRALQVYRDTDNSMESRYARAWAYSRQPNYPRAQTLLDSLLKDYPDDPYFLESKGELFIEQGKPLDAIPVLQRAVNQKPGESLIRTELGQAQVDSEKPEFLRPAIENLEMASRSDPDNGESRLLLSSANTRNGQLGIGNLAQAERAALAGKRAEARNFATRAMREIPEGTPAWLRAQDVLQMSERNRQ